MATARLASWTGRLSSERRRPERHPVLQQIAAATFAQQRRAKRFQNLRLGLVATYLLLLLIPLAITFLNDSSLSRDRHGDHTALIEAKDRLAEDVPPNAKRIVADIRGAFEALRAKAVILRIDSPGGSLVEPNETRADVLRLSSKRRGLICAVVDDPCQAAVYLLATTADLTSADNAFRVDGIAASMDGFGLHEAIKRLRIERRSLTAGAHKAIRDPFRPQSAEDRVYLKRCCWTGFRCNSSSTSPRGGGHGWSAGPRCSVGCHGAAPGPVILA